jgi:hypothetical protein
MKGTSTTKFLDQLALPCVFQEVKKCLSVAAVKLYECLSGLRPRFLV